LTEPEGHKEKQSADYGSVPIPADTKADPGDPGTDHEKHQAKAGFATGITFDRVIAVFTLIWLAFYTECARRQVELTRGLVGAAKEANAIARNAVSQTDVSLKLATRQLSLGEDARRGRIAVEQPIGGAFSGKPGAAPEPLFMTSIPITVVNKGSLDARAIQMLYGCIWYSVAEPSIEICGRAPIKKATLPPSASRYFDLAPTNTRVSQTLAGAPANASSWALFRIRYEDGIGGVRQSDGCWRAGHDLVLIPCLNVVTDTCISGTCLDGQKEKH
jgi:hypothetical protein